MKKFPAMLSGVIEGAVRGATTVSSGITEAVKKGSAELERLGQERDLRQAKEKVAAFAAKAAFDETMTRLEGQDINSLEELIKQASEEEEPKM